MVGIYKFEDVTKYIKDNIIPETSYTYDISERIEQCYNLISNPFNRVNDKDKQWVAYVTQASEDITAVDAIVEIIAKAGLERSREVIIETVNEVGNFFVKHGQKDKPRIPFYIFVLDSLIP